MKHFHRPSHKSFKFDNHKAVSFSLTCGQMAYAGSFGHIRSGSPVCDSQCMLTPQPTGRRPWTGNICANPVSHCSCCSHLSLSPGPFWSLGRCVLYIPHLPPGEWPRLPPHHRERQLLTASETADRLTVAGPHQRWTLWQLHCPGPLHF